MKIKIKSLLLLFSFAIVFLFLSSPLTVLGTNNAASPLSGSEETNFIDSLLSLSQEDENDTDEEEDDDNDDVDDELEELNKREVQVEVDDNEAKIESELKNGDSKDAFKVELKTDDDGLEIKFQYSSENETIETELEFKVEFYKLIEFIDNDANGIFNSSADEIKQVYNIDTFDPIDYTTEPIGVDTNSHIFEVFTSDGIFGIKIFIVEEFAKVDNNTIVAPTEIKFDIVIRNFEYLDNDSYLALSTKLESSTEYEYEDDTEDEEESRAHNEASVETSMNDYSGFFSWLETASVDGVDMPVKNSPIHDDDDLEEDEQKMYLNYPHGDEIIHDPKIGVKGVLIGTEVTNIPGFSIISLFLALGVIIAVFKIRRVD